MSDDRETINVTMCDVDFGKNTIKVDVEKWGNVGAGKYKLVPIKEETE